MTDDEILALDWIINESRIRLYDSKWIPPWTSAGAALQSARCDYYWRLWGTVSQSREDKTTDPDTANLHR